GLIAARRRHITRFRSPALQSTSSKQKMTKRGAEKKWGDCGRQHGPARPRNKWARGSARAATRFAAIGPQPQTQSKPAGPTSEKADTLGLRAGACTPENKTPGRSSDHSFQTRQPPSCPIPL